MSHIGTRIRDRRLAIGLSQTDFAARLGISGSYLNLIEHNRRRIGPKLLDDIARVLMVDAATLDSGAGPEVIARLQEAGKAAGFVAPDLAQAADLATRFPRWADLLATQAAVVAGQTDDGADALHDIVSAIASTAQALVDMPDLPEDWQDRFARRIAADSRRLHGLLLRAQPRAQPTSPWQAANDFLNSGVWHGAFLAGEVPNFGALEGATVDLVAPYLEDLGRHIAPDLRQAIARTQPAGLRLPFSQALQLHGELASDAGLMRIDARGQVTRFKPLGKMTDLPDCLLWPIYAEELSLGRPVTRQVQSGDSRYHVTAVVVPRTDELSPRDRIMVWRKAGSGHVDAVACAQGACRH